MPYTMNNMPESMKGAPKHAVEIFIAAFNTAFEKSHVEGAAMAIAMAAVHKAGYKKDEKENWMQTTQNKTEFEFLLLKSLDMKEAPAEIQIAPLGEFEDAYGRKFRITQEDVQNILANAGAKTNELVIDYEHQTLSGSEAPAAAWVKKLIDKTKEGIWAVVDWTERAKQYLQNKEYRYLSPVLLARTKDADGYYHPEMLHSAALTNTPQIDGMVPIVNRNCGKCAINPHGRDTAHRVPTENKEVEMEKLLELLGLKPEATEDEAVLALTALKAKAEKSPEVKEIVPKGIVESLGLKEGASLSEITGTILALKQPGNVVSLQEFQELKKKLAIRDRDDLVALAMKDGKIDGAQKEWAEGYALKDPEGFKVFVAKAPVVVPMDKLPGGPAGSGANDLASRRDAAIAEHMKKNEGATYREAALFVAKQNPELFPRQT